jgi:hypothetical protein
METLHLVNKAPTSQRPLGPPQSGRGASCQFWSISLWSSLQVLALFFNLHSSVFKLIGAAGSERTRALEHGPSQNWPLFYPTSGPACPNLGLSCVFFIMSFNMYLQMEKRKALGRMSKSGSDFDPRSNRYGNSSFGLVWQQLANSAS